MKWTFQLALHDLMRRDERVHLLWGDVGGGLFKQHIADFPSRCINVGVCEQATVGMASGMAMMGLRPICYTITPFLIERAFEQIKIDVNQMRQPVGLVGHSDENSGPTHIELNAPVLMGLCDWINGFYPKTKEQVTETMASINLEEAWFMALKTVK